MGELKLKFIFIFLILICISLAAVWQSMAAIDSKSIVGIWLLESNKNAEDSSINSHDGEIKGNLSLVDGVFGKALEFPGLKDSVIEVKHADSLNLTTFTFALWVKIQDTAQYQAVFIKTADGLTENYSGYIYDSRKVFWTRFTSGGPAQWGFQRFGTTIVTDDRWHHFAGTYDMKSVKSYIDGNLEADAPFNGKPDISPGPLSIGGCPGFPYPVKGIMDDVGLFNVALSEKDIKEIMDKGLAETALAVSPSGRLAVTWGNIKSNR